jgi:hypothetical protein
MASLSPKDRVSLCLFTYEDGRRCRTPRISSHPHFCFCHAQKESQSQSAEKLAKELAYFFSGDYLSACDLNTAVGRLIPAIIRGQIKPRIARTVAYMFQTLMQSTRLAQHEYINAFGTDGWRDAVYTSVTSNHDHLYPPDPNAPAPDPEDEFEDTPEPGDDPETDADDMHLAPSTPPAQHVPSTPVGAGLVYPACPEERREPRRARADAPTQPDRPTQPPPQLSAAATPSTSSSTRPTPAETEAALNIARSIFPDRANATQSQPTAPTQLACHPERSEGPCLDPALSTIDETQLPTAATPTPTQTAQPNDAPPSAPPPSQTRRQPGAPIREPYAVHFDHNYRLYVDGKPW